MNDNVDDATVFTEEKKQTNVEEDHKAKSMHQALGEMVQSAHFNLLPSHLATYTSPKSTGTSIKGPTVDARA